MSKHLELIKTPFIDADFNYKLCLQLLAKKRQKIIRIKNTQKLALKKWVSCNG